MRIYITGSNGFLAQKFCELIAEKKIEVDIFGVSKSKNRNFYLKDINFQQIDLTDFDKLSQSLNDFNPTHILHTAAITAVEACEINKDMAYKTNVALTDFLANYCFERSIHMTFISTDFVFDGVNGPYSEDDITNPVNYYGETKVLAEKAILNLRANCAILRTILVYGAIPDDSRSNLVLWAKSQLGQGNSISVVTDQWRMPTWVDDLANACILAMNQSATGIFHVSGSEMMTIKEAVLYIADTLNLDKSLISNVSALELGQDKNRPRKTGFVLSRSKSVLGYEATSFVDSLQYICKQLKKYGR